MMTSNKEYFGIDYSGHGATCNRNLETGIRFGIIAENETHGFIWEEVETEYFFGCPHCGNEFSTKIRDSERDPIKCKSCKEVSKRDDCWGEEPIATYYETEDLKYFVDSSNDIWVTFSRYVTFAMYCSPCVPGGCSLGSPVSNYGPIAFCLPPEYFEGEKPPYDIYTWEVETNEVGKKILAISDLLGEVIRRDLIS